MNEKYKIGTISKILGIPSQTLHYYETCGFVTPQKDEKSGYRYYDAWDINFLLDSKYWQSYEFSNINVGEMINQDTILDIKEKLSSQKDVLIDKLVFLQNLIGQLNEEQTRLDKITTSLNQYELTTNPILYFDSYRKRNSYQSSNTSNKLPKMDQWIKAFPFAQPTFLIDQNSLTSLDADAIAYWWGFSITPQKAQELQLDFCKNATFLPAKKCLYTIFEASDKHTFSKALIQQVFKPIHDQRYEIVSDPVGKLIIRAHEEDTYKRYFEIWVPVN